ncbi:MAG: hypothetical protein JNJ54_00835 [Myxococcaceae bacterium]|nr:hypothetical protein [Myxococcaceae bacterium]
MSLLPDDATFHERVQDLFTAYRGRGVALSADDVELVQHWAEAEVPFEVVARGIRVAAERVVFDAPDGQGNLRFLRACRKTVEAELGKYLKRAAGKTEAGEAEEALHLARHKKLKSVVKKLAQRWPAIEALPLGPPHDFEASERQEHLVITACLRALPFSDRLALLREARRLRGGEPTSAAARRESLRFHRAALARHRLDLPSFW